MRRFEFVEGSSAKFWQAEVSGKTFSVVYGKIGTAGQKKDKDFPSETAAQKEYEKKVAEKVKEGYKEVGAVPAAPVEEKAPEPPKRPVAPPRFEPIQASAEAVGRAIKSLQTLRSVLGARSWVVGQRAKLARRSLEAIAGYNPVAPQAFAEAFDALMSSVVAKKGEPRLSLRLAMELLSELHVQAFERALLLWKDAPEEAPAKAAVSVLAQQRQTLDDAELALRLGALLADRPTAEVGWERRWKGLKPHLDALLVFQGKAVKDFLKGLDGQGDKQVARRISALR